MARANKVSNVSDTDRQLATVKMNSSVSFAGRRGGGPAPVDPDAASGSSLGFPPPLDLKRLKFVLLLV
jgi:hypothetical protein